MVQAVGGSVTYLKRLSMGTLSLDETLSKGSYRALTEQGNYGAETIKNRQNYEKED